MPEGDTIHHAAHRIRPILLGTVPDEVLTPHPRFGADRWPQRLAGREVVSVDAHGKHLFLRFDGDLTIHSHLRMTGSWHTGIVGKRWRRSPRRAWLILRARGHEVVEFDGPVLELLTESRTRFDKRLAALGPDICVPPFDTERFLRRLRQDDPTRSIGDALLDQRTVAGIGNIWKSEACWEARVDPRRKAGKVSDDEARALVHLVHPRMVDSATSGTNGRDARAYGRDGRACKRCRTTIVMGRLGDDNRSTYWCPGCQA